MSTEFVDRQRAPVLAVLIPYPIRQELPLGSESQDGWVRAVNLAPQQTLVRRADHVAEVDLASDEPFGYFHHGADFR
jgi:hypothetical protein